MRKEGVGKVANVRNTVGLGPWRSKFVCLLSLLSSLVSIYFRFRQEKHNFKAMSPWIGKTWTFAITEYKLLLTSILKAEGIAHHWSCNLARQQSLHFSVCYTFQWSYHKCHVCIMCVHFICARFTMYKVHIILNF